ncbi:MAG TPA: tyrosine--tRNA ligase [Candidatus Saccharimonadales bacterium]|nr:tyrosine--tRNA ligase [Candidatus Saccharimonadales bacterium]
MKTGVQTDPKVIDQVISDFARTTDEIVSLGELKKLLTSGRKLVMKYGVDVTAPDLHIGHAVNLWMYRRMQELGHKVIFLIGDFTTQIGDPTGKNKTRPIIPLDEIRQNAEAFIKQAMLVLHDDPELVEVRRNSEWYDAMQAKELLSLMSTVTHDRLVSREMFRKRIADGGEIYENELIYPILQGYDSVELKADLTIIGSDQLFNEMMGRTFQEKFGLTPQVIITTKITAGIDGKAKQSKSLGNYIGLQHSARDKFGRVMSIPDSLIGDYFEVYTDVPIEEVATIKANLAENAMRDKLRLAWEIVKRYHGKEAADKERHWFERTFSQKEAPEGLEPISVGARTITIYQLLLKVLASEGPSNSSVRRLLDQGAVSVDGKTIKEIDKNLELPAEGVILKVGKLKWFKVTP